MRNGAGGGSWGRRDRVQLTAVVIASDARWTNFKCTCEILTVLIKNLDGDSLNGNSPEK